MQDFEKLGVFYLGKEFDPATSRLSDSLVLYDSKDLVTHAVCVGMTGSGKTGLCVSLLEEAAIDGIHAEGHDAIVEPFMNGSDVEVPVITISGEPVVMNGGTPAKTAG